MHKTIPVKARYGPSLLAALVAAVLLIASPAFASAADTSQPDSDRPAEISAIDNVAPAPVLLEVVLGDCKAEINVPVDGDFCAMTSADGLTLLASGMPFLMGDEKYIMNGSGVGYNDDSKSGSDRASSAAYAANLAGNSKNNNALRASSSALKGGANGIWPIASTTSTAATTIGTA